jgi:hypothetical protein
MEMEIQTITSQTKNSMNSQEYMILISKGERNPEIL